ncbi:MAG: sulfite exporter TauE/SafE family protein [Candidatus Helarchaeota archaeon]
MSYMEILIILLIVGFLVAIPTSMVGLGGGVLFTPILIIFFNFHPNNAIAISLMAMLGNTVSCSVSYIIQKRINYKIAIIYDLADLPGVLIGAWLTVILPYNIMVGIISVTLYFMGAILLKKIFEKNSLINNNNTNYEYEFKKSHFYYALISSFFSGLIAGLVGIGGGTADTTTMILLGLPPHIAGPTSEFSMAFTNIIAVIIHGLLGNILWDYAIPITIGAILGGQIGAHYSKRVNPRILVTVFAWVSATRLCITALYPPPLFTFP